MRRLIKKTGKQLLALTALIGFSALSFAADPKIHLELVTKNMSAEILSNKDKIKADSNYAKSLIETHLLPQVDTTYMAKRILGKTHWTSANETQRQTFIREFIGLMLNTYAKGLASYDGQPITYSNTRYSKSGKTANVPSKIDTGDGEPILISYRLKMQPNESWLIIDVIIEGVSMAKSFASQYREQISEIGLDATLLKLAKENSSAAEATEITDS